MQLVHRNLLIGIHDSLQETFFQEKKYADKVMERCLKANRKWGSQDRQVVSEIFYNIIRWKRSLEFYMGEGAKPSNIYKLILTYLLWSDSEFKKFDEFSGIKIADIKNRIKSGVRSKAVEHSIPDWLAERMQTELGDIWEREMRALNQQTYTVLRTNTLRISRENLIKELEQEGVNVDPLSRYPDAIQLEVRKNVFITDAFKSGFFEVQDASSQEIGYFLDVDSTMRVIDACAGAGGKTLHLAALMQNKGQIIAMDIFEWKLAELKRRAKRAGAHNISTKMIEDTKTIKRLHNTADRVLIDAPCSGLGVLKRNPDTKWKIDEAFLNRIHKEQETILQNYSKMLKINGKLLYATCSIFPSENQEQVAHFLKNNPDYSLEKDQTLLPSQGYDGFYMALIRRNA